MNLPERGAPACAVCGISGSVERTGLTTCADSIQMGRFSVYRCAACGNGFTYPPVAEELYRLLPDVPRVTLSQGKQIILDRFIQNRVLRIRKNIAPGPDVQVLDIGGGSSAFANAAARRGYAVTVIEPNEQNATFADSGHGVRFLASRFSEHLLDEGTLTAGSFDAITMWHSLEHFSHPAEALRLAHRLLKSGGILLVSVPDIDSWQSRFGGNLWTYLDVPHHLTHFSPAGLVRVLRSAGFTPERTYPVSLEYDLFGWFQTLLNVASRSCNYYYNRTKKNRSDEGYLPHPRWTKFMTALAPAFLPPAAAITFVAAISGNPSCIEILCRKNEI